MECCVGASFWIQTPVGTNKELSRFSSGDQQLGGNVGSCAEAKPGIWQTLREGLRVHLVENCRDTVTIRPEHCAFGLDLGG